MMLETALAVLAWGLAAYVGLAAVFIGFMLFLARSLLVECFREHRRRGTK